MPPQPPAPPIDLPFGPGTAPLSRQGEEKGRFLFVDAMRGLAMMVMIEVHTINSLMQPGYRRVTWFGLLDFLNGLVAPAFLFVAGFAFLLANERCRDELGTGGPPLMRTVGRIGLIWLTGYLLHIPYFSLHDWHQLATPEQWRQFFSVDVLQCIACGLSILLGARLLANNERTFSLTIGLLLCLAVLPAPWVYRTDLGWLPFGVAAYLRPLGSTLFPLLPWFGFMAAGVLAGRLFLDARQRGDENRWVARMALLGTGLSAVSLPLLFVLKDQLGWIVDERPHLLFFTGRLGCVLLLLALCHLVCHGKTRGISLLRYSSRESLMVYFVHLQILYRPFWEGKSLVMRVGQQYSLVASLGMALLLVSLMLPLAWGWHRVKQRYRRASRHLLHLVLVGGTVLFLVG